MKRILCIVSSMDAGGAETFLMKLYRHFDRERYQMDFCVNTDENFYADEIEAMGGGWRVQGRACEAGPRPGD